MSCVCSLTNYFQFGKTVIVQVIGEKAGKVKLKKLDNLPNIIQLNELGLLKLIADKLVAHSGSTQLLIEGTDQ